MKKLYITIFILSLLLCACSDPKDRFNIAAKHGKILYQKEIIYGNDDLFVVIDKENRLKIVFVSDRLIVYRVDYIDPRRVYFITEENTK